MLRRSFLNKWLTPTGHAGAKYVYKLLLCFNSSSYSKSFWMHKFLYKHTIVKSKRSKNGWCIYLDSILWQAGRWTLFEVWSEILVHMLKHQIKWHLSFSPLTVANVQKSEKPMKTMIYRYEIMKDNNDLNKFIQTLKLCELQTYY